MGGEEPSADDAMPQSVASNGVDLGQQSDAAAAAANGGEAAHSTDAVMEDASDAVKAGAPTADASDAAKDGVRKRSADDRDRREDRVERREDKGALPAIVARPRAVPRYLRFRLCRRPPVPLPCVGQSFVLSGRSGGRHRQ